MAAAHSDLIEVHYDPDFVLRKGGAVKGKVGVISGGGSGHEPMHGGFVGKGMLDAACPGAVFTSPVPDQMLAATKAVDGGAGVLHIVKNYTGDVMNFEMAAEMAAAEGSEVVAIVTNDDVAVKGFIGNLLGGGHNTNRQWQIIRRPLFSNIGRSHIDDNFMPGPFVTVHPHGRFDTLLALFHGIVGQAHHKKFDALRNIHLHGDGIGIDATDC